jgi:hypothetical protein
MFDWRKLPLAFPLKKANKRITFLLLELLAEPSLSGAKNKEVR